MDYVRYWSDRTELTREKVLAWAGLSRGKYHCWRDRYGKVNEHNAWVPRDFWLEQWEKEAIVRFYTEHPLEGYRRLTYMMIDADVLAASSSSVYRVLKEAGLLERWNRSPSKKGTGFVQPLVAHEHWHTDITYVNICGTFYYLLSVLDGFSRHILHWDIRESMTERDVEMVLQRAREKFPRARARLISDNGPQFVAKELKEYIRICGMTHVRTSPYYPQSNGKQERWYGTLKSEGLRRGVPGSLEEARRIVERFVETYNTVRLHGAIGYVAPKDKLEGRAEAILAERERKLAEARQRRAQKRRDLRESLTERKEDSTMVAAGEQNPAANAGMSLVGAAPRSPSLITGSPEPSPL